MKSKLKKFILFLITVLFLYFVFVNLNIRELFGIIKGFDIKYLIALAISITISQSFRAMCFKELISGSTKAPLRDLIPLCITGSALNIVLPARAGDLFRAFYVGSKYKVDKVKVLGTVILERFFDMLVIISILMLGILFYHKSPLAQKLCIGSIGIFIFSLIFIIFTVKFNKIDDICKFFKKKTAFLSDKFKSFLNSFIDLINKFLNSFISGFEVINQPKKLLLVIFYSSAIWIFECLNYYIVIQGFNCEVSGSVVLFIISFIALACMIPSTSVFVGPYQFAVISAFAIYNIPKETALAISLVEQAGITIVMVAVAAVFLLKNNISYKELKEDINFKQD